MRLFVAIDLTDDARQAIAATQTRIAARMEGVGSPRFVRAEDLHLTLAFIGEVDETTGAAIAGAMAADIDQEPFDLVFGGVGVFPAAGAPRVLWLGVTRGAESAAALERQVAERLDGAGVRREPRPFTPHLTLARWRRSRPSDARRAVAEHVGAVAHVPVTGVTLYQSRLSASGPSYAVLRRTSLGPRRAR